MPPLTRSSFCKSGWRPHAVVRTLEVGDLGDNATYDSLSEKVLKMTIDEISTSSFDKSSEITLKWKWVGPGENWWIDIASNEDFAYALKVNQSNGFIQLSANVRGTRMHLSSVPESVPSKANTISSESIPPAKMKVATKKKTSSKHRNPGSTSCRKSNPQQKIASAIRELNEIGIGSPKRQQVAHLSDYPGKENAGFKKVLSALSSAGYIEYIDGDGVCLTRLGMETFKGVPTNPPASNEEFHDRIKKTLKLGQKQIQIFDFLSDGLAKDRLAAAAAAEYPNDNTPGIKKTLSKMGSAGLISSTTGSEGEKLLQLTEFCFPFGRPWI